MTKVKICGCMRVRDALAAKEAGADFIGILFAPSSRRRVSTDRAREIVEALGRPRPQVPALAPPGDGDVAAWFRCGAELLDRLLAVRRPLTVGVFEDQPLDEVNAIAEACGLDLVQLSGHESWDDCRRAARPAVKAFELSADGDPLAGLEAGSAVACLLDASRGRGIEHDRACAAALAARLPLWLAGGLTPDTVARAVREVRPWAVDVSSGVETDGAKDPEKIRAFVAQAKSGRG
jgi:phosphoribosylanthranilate isomerase